MLSGLCGLVKENLAKMRGRGHAQVPLLPKFLLKCLQNRHAVRYTATWQVPSWRVGVLYQKDLVFFIQADRSYGKDLAPEQRVAHVNKDGKGAAETFQDRQVFLFF